jgi:uncharacterized protein
MLPTASLGSRRATAGACAPNWLRAHQNGAAAYVVLASTHERALEAAPLAALQEHTVDVPLDPGPFGA